MTYYPNGIIEGIGVENIVKEHHDDINKIKHELELIKQQLPQCTLAIEATEKKLHDLQDNVYRYKRAYNL